MANFFKIYLDALGNEGLFTAVHWQVRPSLRLKIHDKVYLWKAGLKGNYINHSGKRTCATALYQKRVDEKEIMGRMGHRSEMWVRAYKCGNTDFACAVSRTLDPPEPKYQKKEPEEAFGHLVEIFNKLNVSVPEKLDAGGSGSCSFNNCTFISY